ncbi:TPA: restriction endonuclease subunit S [Vibrio parahaemolyticus]|uniref:restriction endonuclease subunit S n=1 Tax=Vibrio harveyi group TaxID=717610 RepID=UPI00040D6B44|nr:MULTISPECIES: restriction endonuclease subunit S [Vibrio harveyi group]EGR3414613.1 restriction endonuclease subunit S [Vibrio parahaemolyticus]EJE4185967.1 restriction endonuclease subunit S [Vibrio parahaemolyticus]EJG1728568.1 restriction endonuclease subunit S [Vibrio parahaemolyticus]EJG1865638.1 restriction endonuclease subunit S [Vibrio parahaemolyticus]EKA4546813.1 restriction endonuclease subunit S [Vibrio parahaemolyticus]
MALQTDVLKIKDLGSVITGGTPPTKQRHYYGDAVPLIKPTDMVLGQRYIGETEESLSEAGVDKFKNKLVPANTPCVVTIGTIGKSCLTKERSLVNQAVNCVVVDTEKFDIMYVYYLLQLTIPKVKSLNSGTASGRENVSKSVFENIEVKVVSSRESQAEIGDYLSNYDTLIENNNRRIAILEDMAQSLYREWFVNFRYPNHEDNLDADGDAKLVDSPLGQIPEGWEIKRLDDFVILQRGFDLPKKKRNEKGCVPIYAASGINGYHDQVKAKGPGIVTGRSGTLGIVNLVLEDHWPLNTSLWVKEFKGCTAFYAYYLLDSIGLERFNSGASVPTLNRNDVHGNPVIAPPKELIKKFENIVCVNHKQINVLKRKNENLKKQRDMLLPKLISGEIEL